MTMFLHELKQGSKSLWIWSGIIAIMIIICMIMFPEMSGQVDEMNEMFESMGSFTAAFGLDKINFGSAMGFYGVECGNMLGIGGALFAALLGISALAKEEKDKTAEFLLTHPVSRVSVVVSKLAAAIIQVITLNVISVIAAVASFALIGEDLLAKEFMLFHIAQLAMQLEIVCLCFGVSAFLRKGGLGIGIGIATLMYFLNIVCNISEEAEFLKYITPFKYAEASDVISNVSLDTTLILIGGIYAVFAVVCAFIKYSKKDIM